MLLRFPKIYRLYCLLVIRFFVLIGTLKILLIDKWNLNFKIVEKYDLFNKHKLSDFGSIIKLLKF